MTDEQKRDAKLVHQILSGDEDAFSELNALYKQRICEFVMVLDNTKIHKTRRTRELIEASGAEVLFLPPYSPDYNLIEHDFANIKW